MSEQNISGIDLTLFLNSCGIPAARIDREGAVRAWRDLFRDGITPELKARTQDYNEEFNWHIFSFGLVRAVGGTLPMYSLKSAVRIWLSFSLKIQMMLIHVKMPHD